MAVAEPPVFDLINNWKCNFTPAADTCHHISESTTFLKYGYLLACGELVEVDEFIDHVYDAWRTVCDKSFAHCNQVYAHSTALFKLP